MSYTPGPWLISKGWLVYALNEDGTNRMSTMPCGGYVRQTSYRHERTTPEEVAANAKLIAAAPDLVEALKMMLLTHPSRNPWAQRVREDAYAVLEEVGVKL